MPSSGLIHFYQDYGRINDNKFVSMPSSGLIHFYDKMTLEAMKLSGCQCPQAGLFISTEARPFVGSSLRCVNALKRAYSFLHYYEKRYRKNSKLCQCPQAGLFISTDKKYRAYHEMVMCQCPQAGLFISTPREKFRKTRKELCQCPQAGLFISTEEERRRTLPDNCVNALKRAYSFLQNAPTNNEDRVDVSMPSSGLIHFYFEMILEEELKAAVSMPSSGLFHFYF